MKKYSLSKSRSLFKWFNNRYKKKHSNLNLNQKAELENILENLDVALVNHDREKASQLSQKLDAFEKPLAKSFFEQTSEFIGVVLIAVLVATLLRQTVFEAYEIPTGSMRPTFKEQDDVLVSKTAYGINMPFSTDHLYFDKNLVKRGGIIIFSGDGIDLPDTDSHYLWLFPYKKRYTKRLMGKPGDTIYFYGGKVYGMDSDGNFLKDLQGPWNKNISYTPYVYMEGLVRRLKKNEFIYKQMNEEIARTELLSFNRTRGDVFNGKEWVKDNVEALKKPHNKIQTYSDFWGFKNFAQSRLLTKAQAKAQNNLQINKDDDALLYLQLKHTPHLNSDSSSLFMQDSSGVVPVLNTFTTFIPLNEKHLEAIMNNLYTARFVIKDGKASRYSYEKNKASPYSPSFPNVPDGTYEFYYGKGYEITHGSISKELPKDHPLYSKDPQNVQKLYNYGIDFNINYEPTAKNTINYPPRFTFFKDGDLISMNGIILTKDDPTLISFNNAEKERQISSDSLYVAFQDYGAPVHADGSIDKEFMKAFGLKIKDGHYLALGDNYAMSADSRLFGFVPEANLQGAPVFLIWPPGPRWGAPAQNAYDYLSFPTLLIWSILGLIALTWWIYQRNQKSKLQFKKLS